MNDRHHHAMQRALELARRGIFSASPNPRVGCVITSNGHIIGEGFHERAGEPHAEVHALRQAGDAARGATAYVTLEPCAHFGRTPPCADALIAAGIAEVFIACVDPNPQVAGQGIARLEAAGIRVHTGLCEAEALHLNRAFFHRMRSGRPFVTLKLAASMDGRTALASGESQWITGEAAREDVHFHRLAADAIIAGTGSVIHDNARLTARHATDLAHNPPLRVVIDSALRTPADAALFADLSPVWLASTQSATDQPYPAHARVVTLPAKAGKVDLGALLDALGEAQINHAFVEAGAGLAGAFLDANLADEILLYLAPTFLGADARPLVAIQPLAQLADKKRFIITDSRAIGDDWRFTLTPK
ncbi:MAG: bifunctional diaminohydroxyphosphoribosylaminopyrimidine deaminase/5-amino-6-(5-phosphoribosylamino)uracil reductase RibD [Cardiobacteriaceae bacterium]|nr:bifunctional diaminohydroxyphosphoribosylaminopyrimidine deaminase/5-amino-6-(5-phosphoribosylamino)uracil reductase RibD [Cardiobacteriaceae bacterium]